jgi:ABC-type transport system involved in multi-copper enzyme maturation permease subunit
MIRKIIRKEILENLLSLRFVLSLLLVISLLAASGFVFVGKYRQESEDYWKKTNKNLSALSEHTEQLYQLAFYQQEIYRKPKPLGLCAEGFEKSLPNYFSFNVFTAELPEIGGQSNFALPRFSDIDWVFIISLIVSFVALVFTYDSICGEKQAGTLRQMLAGAIPRHKILLGKYFGVMLTLGIPLLLGLLVNLIAVVSSKDVAVNAADWLRIAIIVLLSVMYVSIFVLLGMFVSSRTGHPANSMVILLLAWVVLIVLIPGLGRIVSDISSESPTQEELERALTEAHEQVDGYVISGKYGDRAGSFHPDLDNPINNPPGRARYDNARTDARNRVLEGHYNQMTAQAFAGRNFTCMSPASIYRRASEAIAGTGISRCVSLYQQIKQYQADLKEYIRGKDQEDPDSLHLLIPFDYAVKSWGTISKKPVDFDSVPKFQERDLGLGESLQLAIWDIGLLVLFNLVFFAASFVSFLRYDVR